MKIAIHQPHYFPWVGYLDKMAKADKFILLDEVQLEKGSQMIRNRVLDNNGEIKYLNISGETKDFLNREYNKLQTKNIAEWTNRQLNALQSYYRKAPFAKEIFSIVEEYFDNSFSTIFAWTNASIKVAMTALEIHTPIILQSQIDYDRSRKKSDLVYAICNALGADTYFSGRGASVDYLDRDKFKEAGVNIVFQDFTHPIYRQINTNEFVPGLSALDMLFNCGIEQSREIFWDNVNKTNEFGE